MLKNEDVASILGYANPTKAVITHVDADDKLHFQIGNAGQRGNIIFINESGLNSLMLSGKDVASILGYSKPQNAILAHVDDEDKTDALIQGTGSNYKNRAILINESGLYSLILSGKDVESVMGELQCKQGSF